MSANSMQKPMPKVASRRGFRRLPRMGARRDCRSGAAGVGFLGGSRRGGGKAPRGAGALGEDGEEGCGDGDAEGGGADGEADPAFRRVKDAGEQRQERLGAVEVDEGEHAAEEGGEDLGVGAETGGGWCVYQSR